MKKINALMICALAVVCVSCNGSLGDRRSNNLYFRVSMTRGAAITTDSLNKANQFFIANAYLEADGRGGGEGSSADLTKARYIDSVKFTHDGSKWSAGGCTWRNEVTTNFWCYKPAQMTYGTRVMTHCDATSQLPSDDAQKTMSFVYTMPTPASPADGHDAEKQEDMIFAYARKTYNGSGNVVNIEFSHALSAIRFSQGAFPEGADITSITIKGFNTTGKCTMYGEYPASPAAENSKDTIRYVWSDWSGASANTGYCENVTFATLDQTKTGDKMFIVIPQALTDDVKVDVMITQGGSSFTKSASLNSTEGITWMPGKYYTYKLKYTGTSDLEATLEDFNGTDWTTHDSQGTSTGTFTGENW